MKYDNQPGNAKVTVNAAGEIEPLKYKNPKDPKPKDPRVGQFNGPRLTLTKPKQKEK